MSSLKVIKLINGDEIIGLIEDGRDHPPSEDGYSTDNLLFISSPMKITSNYNYESRTHSIFLSDWVPAIADETLVVEKNQIITLGNPNREIEEHYCELLIINQLSEENSNDVQQKNDNDIKNDKLNKILKNHKFDDDDMN